MNSINNTESAKNVGYNNSSSGLTATDVQGAVDEIASGLINIGSSTDLGNVQGNGTIALADSISNYRFILILVGYYRSGFPCFGQALLPVLVLPISTDDITTSIAFTDGHVNGRVDISFLSATSAKVINTSDTLYTRIVGIA